MHDVLGNIITSIAVTAQAAERFHQDKTKVLELVEKISDYSRQATDFLRTGLTVLDNIDSGGHDLYFAVKRRFSDLLETVDITLCMEVDEAVCRLRIPPEVTINVLRCFHEAVHNIIKHSRARNVTISLTTDGAFLTTAITDDGMGLPDTKNHGYGLNNISRRIEALDGTLTMGPLAPSGTVIALSVPVTR